MCDLQFLIFRFLSTPSGWRATAARGAIHAPAQHFYPRPPGGGRPAMRDPIASSSCISIHALRVEGDSGICVTSITTSYFYPRPPGGGRQAIMDGTKMVRVDFYPRPPGGGRQGKSTMARPQKDFYPRPPGGGRRLRCRSRRGSKNFYPRPPGGGRQQKRTKFSSVFAQKGEEFASLRHGKRKICRWRFKKDKFWGLIWCEGSGKSVYALASHCG